MADLFNNLPAVFGILGGVTAFVTFVWHVAMYVGRLTLKVERHGDRLDEHDKAIERIEAVIR